MGAETLIIAALATSAAAAVGGTTVGVMNYMDAKKAREAQEALENKRKAGLALEAKNKAAAVKAAESSGQRAGLGGRATIFGSPSAGATGFGGAAPSTNIGRSTLFGN